MDKREDIEDAGLPRLTATGLSVSLTVSDLGRSVAWYRDGIGFDIERRFEREGKPFAASLRSGPVALLLTQDDGARGSGRTKGGGFSIRFTTLQNVDALAERVRGQGAPLDTEPFDGWGMRTFRVRDPDGFLLVISSEAQGADDRPPTGQGSG